MAPSADVTACVSQAEGLLCSSRWQVPAHRDAATGQGDPPEHGDPEGVAYLPFELPAPYATLSGSNEPIGMPQSVGGAALAHGYFRPPLRGVSPGAPGDLPTAILVHPFGVWDAIRRARPTAILVQPFRLEKVGGQVQR